MVLLLTATNFMPKCPYCSYHRCYKLRRQHAKCKRCKREWSIRNWLVPGIKASEIEWIKVLDSFLRDFTIRSVVRETGLKQNQVHKMLSVIRQAMHQHMPDPFSGPVEIDDAYLGPRWLNRRSWQRHTKRGRGTDQQPLVGVFDQTTGLVMAWPISKVRWADIGPLLLNQLNPYCMVYTDTYSCYRFLKRNGYGHKSVDHIHEEYVRGEVTVNHIESFWGYVKRRFKVTGGLRRNRLNLYLAEWVWRYNHRKLSREAKVKRLHYLLKELKIGGRK